MRRNAALWLGPWLVASATSCDGGAGAVGALPCGTGSACDSGWVCVDERCVRLCNTDATCQPSERCEDGICVEDQPACRTEADCVAPAPCELRSAAAFCRGGACHYEEIACAEQAPARPCLAPTGACDPLLANGTCTGVECCVYAPAWPAGSSGVSPSCPVDGEDSNDNGVEDGSEAWSGTCGHDGDCLLPNGSGCQTADLCLSGFCADGVCCDGACGGACDHCDLDGLAGTCTGCGVGYQCVGTDVCLPSAGTACQTGQQCASGVCAGSGVCCGDGGVACWRSVDAGTEFACALSNDGLAWCWGRDGHGQLGNDAVMVSQNVPVAVASVSSGVSISTGTWSACARLADGTAMCWGDDNYGQLGNDADRTSQGTPVQVAGVTSAVSISAGSRHTCAVLSNGTAWCWGFDDHGQLGDNTELATKTTPAQVQGLAGVASIDAGDLHTCAVLSSGTAWCWGSDGGGRLGDGDPDLVDKSTPVQVASLDSVAAITLGSTHTCALLTDGTVWCWGADNAGQLGDDETRATQGTPVQVAGLTEVAAISAGTAHTCALRAGGSVWCWGSDGNGQLGDDGSYVDQGMPVQVADLAGPAVAISAGYTNTCAALAGGTVWCWGSAAQGVLGNGERAGTHPLPVQVGFGLTGFAGTCSDAAECASGQCLDPLATGTASCWYDGARCGASWTDAGSQMTSWYGEAKYESDQLFVHLRLDSFMPGGDTCDSGWQPGTAVVGCTSSSTQVTYDGVRLAIDSTGCSLFDTVAGDLLATGAWR